MNFFFGARNELTIAHQISLLPHFVFFYPFNDPLAKKLIAFISRLLTYDLINFDAICWTAFSKKFGIHAIMLPINRHFFYSHKPAQRFEISCKSLSEPWLIRRLHYKYVSLEIHSNIENLISIRIKFKSNFLKKQN